MMNFLHKLFDFESDETYGERLFFLLFEMFVVFYVMKFAWEWGFYIQQIDSVLLPLGIANYVDISFMFEDGISLVNAGFITLFGLLGLGGAWRWGYVFVLPLLHLQYVSRYCLGEISHGSNLIGMSVLVLALGAAAISRPKVRRRFVIGGLYFLLGLGYTSAAISKLIGTGLHWPDGHHLWLWIAERQVDTFSKFGATDLNWLQRIILDHPGVGTAVLTFGLLAEFFGFLMWWPRFRPYVLVMLIGMHFGVAFTMDILFDVYIYQLAILAIPLPAFFDWLTRRNARVRGFILQYLPR